MTAALHRLARFALPALVLPALVLPALVLLASAAPASAQLGGSIAIASDDRFRGVSMSEGEPVVTAAIDFDAISGPYAGASATVGLGQGAAGLVSVSGNLGYAVRLDPAVTLDAGVIHSRYSQYGYARADRQYTEIYLGAQARRFSAYLRYSPDYFESGTATLYAEVATAIEPGPGWLVRAHAGLLLPLGGYAEEQPDATCDWSLGLIRRAGPLDIGLTLTGSGSSTGYGAGRDHAGTSLAASLRWSI